MPFQQLTYFQRRTTPIVGLQADRVLSKSVYAKFLNYKLKMSEDRGNGKGKSPGEVTYTREQGELFEYQL